MHISVAGKQIALSDALKHRVSAHLDRISEKYFGQAMEARVTFSRARSFFTCDINLHATRGLTLRGEGEAADAHSAFDDAAEHIASRLRRYHRKATKHGHQKARQQVPEIGRGYVLRPGMPAFSATEDDATVEDEDSALPATGPYATIIAEHPTEIPTLSVSEAVMRLDLADCQIQLFRNSKTETINVLYRRPDGNIGWLDPSLRPN
ncbi:ribosomal subunit interface protein [Komagataeibacter nataicola]|uniref:Ribosome hibernation promoting factor n=1 Tax=Komagataeibacter nataicola TaxID=265960 RepID=A0A9N7CIF2_9PROT|nr:ribosome-associated translation inhibitor RaiA [Komagataeibacter nataicola]AQU88250.1 ribosomal subunit interface protein [Komagataeibacter nataicola]PYD67692.1 ribosomal subunit interface protein [Komagataeibacter nataicola]WEQ54649.1 ribosome-associated translation inhibitor RaiA [Komagataeibacter nataicola]WNM09013.1 ribosome-associated translation inhibitor RaiA [Komagataeibacter nataicola]GBR13962.1 30S ribosomal protein S30 [Komagataeibacter nataicola NRIC 0616]